MASSAVKRSLFGLGIVASLFIIVAYGLWGLPKQKELTQKIATVEIVEARTLTSKTYDLGDGQRKSRFYGAPIHYKAEDGVYRDINTTIMPSDRPGYAYEVEQGNYTAHFRQYFSDQPLVTLDMNGVDVAIESQDLTLTNGNGVALRSLATPQPSIATTNKNHILYPGAYGLGMDVEMMYGRTQFTREFVLHSLDALGLTEYEMNSEEFLDIGFSFSVHLSHNLGVTVGGVPWDGREALVTSETIAFIDPATNLEAFTFIPPLARDALDQTTPLTFRLVQEGNQLFITKLIPLSWLKTAAVPIRADDTLSQYAGGDGYLEVANSTSYATTHNTSTAVTSNTSGSLLSVTQDVAGGIYIIDRVPMYYDTSSIADEATISAATLNLRGTARSGTGHTLYVYDWTEGVGQSTADYDAFGSTSYGSITTAGWSTTGYNVISLTTSVISVTTNTPLFLRISGDVNEIAPTAAEKFTFRSIEQTGTSSDPYLEVTHSTNTAPTVTKPTPSQTAASLVTVTTTIGDADSDTTTLIMEYSTDNSTWASSTISTVSVSEGSITTSTGQISSIDTDRDSSVDLTITWAISTDLPDIEDTTVYIKLTATDPTTGTATTTSAFTIDTKSPTTPGNMSVRAGTVASSSFAFSYADVATSTDISFREYKILYGTTSGSLGSSFTSTSDPNLGNSNFNGEATSATLTGLSPNTVYYYRLYAYDSWDRSTASAAEGSTTTVAAIPSSVTATAATTSTSIMHLSWDANSNGSGTVYQVYNATTAATVATTTATSYAVTGLTANTSYQFQVRAENLGASGTYSDYSAASAAVYTLASPVTGITVSNTSSSSTLQALLSWTNTSQTGMKIERDSGCDGSYDVTLYTNTSSNDTTPTTTASSLSGNTCYVYKISSYNGSGQTSSNDVSVATSSQFTTPPAQPTGLTASSAETTSITWSWSSVSGATHYVLYTYGTDTTIATTTATSYEQTGLSANTQYTVYVRANHSTNGTGVASSLSSSYTDATTPSSITNTSQSTTALTFGWTTTAAESYAQLAGSSGPILQTQDWSAGTTWSVSGLTENTAYTVGVKSRNASSTETGFASSTFYTSIQTPSDISLSNTTATSTVATAGGTFTNLGTALAKLVFSNNAGSTENITSGSTWTSTNLSPNVTYSYSVYGMNGDGDATPSVTTTVTTLANAPGTVTVATSTTSTLVLTLDTNSNSSSTTYAIFDTKTRSYAAAEKTLSTSSSVWQTTSTWANLTITGLTENTQYCFQAIARNNDSTVTASSTAACTYTWLGSDKQYIDPVTDTTVTVDPNKVTLVMGYNDAKTTGNLTTVTIPATVEATTPVYFDVTQIVTSDVVTTSQAITFDKTASSAADAIDMTIPASTVITCSSTSWTQLQLPTLVSASIVSPPTSDAPIQKIVEVGVSGTTCILSNPIKLVFPNAAGNSIGFASTAGSTLTEVTTTCDSSSSPTNIVGDGACKVQVGSDVYVFTKHFSYYATFTPAATGSSAQASSSSSGGGTPAIPGATLKGLLINGLTDAVVHSPMISVGFVGAPSTIVEAALTVASTFANVNWVPVSKGVVSFTLPDKEGVYTLYGKVRDVKGGESVPTSATVVYEKKVVTESPFMLLTPGAKEVMNTLPFTITGKATPQVDVSLSIAGTTYTVTADTDGLFSVTVLDQLIPGQYGISVVEHDPLREIERELERIIIYDSGKEDVEMSNDTVSSTPKQLVIINPIKKKTDKKPSTEGKIALPASPSVPSSVSPSVPPTVKVVPPAPTAAEAVIAAPVTAKEANTLIQDANERKAFLLVLAKNTLEFHKQQLEHISISEEEEVDIVIRPASSVRSITARLYADESAALPGKTMGLQRVFDWLLPGANAKTPVDGKWVQGFLFEKDPTSNVFQGSIHVPKGVQGNLRLVVTLNEADGDQTRLAKSVVTEKKGSVMDIKGNPVPKAKVTVFTQDTKGQYIPWDGTVYGQENPQLTSDNGEYIYFVPPGAYYVDIQSKGFAPYQTGILLFETPGTIRPSVVLTSVKPSPWTRFWGWVGDRF